MRRSPAAFAAAILLLSIVGTALGAEPAPSPSPSAPVSPDPSATAVATPPPSVEPSIEPAPTSPPDDAATPPPEAGSAKGQTRLPNAAADADPTGRWIVVLTSGADTLTVRDRQAKRLGFAADRTFRSAFRGYSARLDRADVEALRRDPSVAYLVADERIEVTAQTKPTGILRVSSTLSSVAKIDGIDERVDADVAIVDTGIASVSDLNVAGGYNCSSTNRAAWRDVYGHGTHVAGTVGAIDNAGGVVGVAPGVRLWAVKILNDNGEGLLSWYVCGLDWIAAQRDPLDASRPLFEAVNMSVAKWGSDDLNCGLTNKDILHQAVCRLVASGVTVVAAAGNDSASASKRVPAAYNEVITVSALADTDGKAGGLGGHRCYSWGTYDSDDTYADFSNFGSDVDLIAPGKCIWSTVPGGYKYSSGTSMAAPHVAGAAALLKAGRPDMTPAEVKEALQYLGTLNWRTSSDPDSTHEKLLDVSRIGPRGDFSVSAGADAVVGEAGGTARFPITITRTATSFERVRLSVSGLPDGFTASFSPSSVYGFSGVASTLSVTVPAGTPVDAYTFTVVGTEHGKVHSDVARLSLSTDVPIAQPPAISALTKSVLGATTVTNLVAWPAATDSSAITAYEVESNVDGTGWADTAATGAAVRSLTKTHTLGDNYQYRVRARDAIGNWSSWADSPTVTSVLLQDRSSAIVYTGRWTKHVYAYSSGGTSTYATALGAKARTTFSGRGIALVAPIGPTRGSAKIYVDGVYRGTISFRSSSGKSRVVMYSRTFPTLGTHTIEVVLTGTGRVDVDAFVILR